MPCQAASWARLLARQILEMTFRLKYVARGQPLIPAKAGIHGAIEIGFPLSRE